MSRLLSNKKKYEISNFNQPTKNARNNNQFQYAKICARKATKDLFTNTSIHGLQYLRANKLWERIFWSVMILVSISFASILIQKTYRNWQERPVIVSFSEKLTPIWHIPFPAITICSETKTQKDIVNFTEIYRRLIESVNNLHNDTIQFNNQTSKSQKEFEYLQTLLQICSTHLVDNIQIDKQTDNLDYLEILDEIVPDFQLTYPICNWKNNLSNCNDLLMKIYTEQGICYTFNGLNPLQLYRAESFQYQQFQNQYNNNERILNWNLENGYTVNNNKDLVYPERVLSAGIRAGLFMGVQGFQQNQDYICRGPVQGFKVILHSPEDFPQVSKNFLRVPYNKEVLVSVSPQLLTTSESLRSYLPIKRQCFFSQERYLKHFQIYSQANCEVECLANYTLMKCGCVQFSMPRSLNTPTCDISQIRCIFDAEHELRQYNFENEYYDEDNQKRNGDDSNENWMNCNCLPACTSLIYHTEISQAEFDMESLLMAYNDTNYIDNHPGFQMSRILIFFKENQFIAMKRSELNGISDFIANCGGIFGLFMGVSVLSVVDILYYLLQFIINYYSKLMKNETNQNNPQKQSNSNQTPIKMCTKQNIFLK